MTVEAYPLAWPQGWQRTIRREDGRFGVSFARARDELLAEISRLNGKLPVISSNMQLRRDGLPYANQPSLDDPGIAVYFTYKGKQMCFACDKYKKVEANMRAIEAVQQWLDNQLLNAGEFGRVTKVEAESKSYGAQTFNVDLEKPDAQDGESK